MRTTRTGVIAIVATLAVSLAACSASKKDESSGPSTTAAPTSRTTRGITDTSVKVGGVIYSLYFGDARVGVEARLKKANDAGGVNGRKIEFIGAEDDNQDAATSLAITQRLVEQQQVFALLPVLSATYGGADYVVENNVPVFGWGVNPAFCGPQVTFGITGCVTDPQLEVGSNALGTGLLAHFKGDADHSVALIGEDNDAGRGGLTLLSASIKDKGFDVVMSDPSLPAPPDPLGDPSPFVSQLMTADGGQPPDVIYLQSTLSGTTISAALQGAGYTGMIITSSYSPLLLGQPGYDAIYVNTQFSMDPSVPANAEMLAAVAAVDPDAKMSLALVAGYWAADMFVKALETTGQDLTVESFLATLNGGSFTYGVPDVVGPSTWPANHDKPVPCSAFTKVEGNAFVPYLPLACGENITVG